MAGRRRILVVDDEPTARLVCRAALEEAGYAVSEAADGERGLLQIRAGPADLILLDLRMPGMGGLGLLRRLRATDAEVPVVVITAHARGPEAEAAKRLGATEIVAKPLSPASLRRAVDNAVGPPSPCGTFCTESANQVVARDDELLPARRALARCQWAEAEQFLLRTLTPGTAEAHYLLGLIHELLREPHSAYHRYKAALETDPTYAPALQAMRVYCERYGLDFHNKNINPAARAEWVRDSETPGRAWRRDDPGDRLER